MVVVFGSINLDLVTRVPRFPSPGETVTGSAFASYPGGKGANQALAAMRAGAAVRMYGAVGQDRAADVALALLRTDGVDVDGVQRIAAATGCATVLVDDAGENLIVVVPGANGEVAADLVPDAVLDHGAVLLLQHEVPPQSNAALIARAARAGMRIVLNAAPARPLTRDLLPSIDTLIVNQSEAAALGGVLHWPQDAPVFAAAAAAEIDGLEVVVTLGEAGAVSVRGRDEIRVKAPPVAVLDTNGRVTQLRVLNSVPLLDQAALDAVRQWRYTPSSYNGRPVSVLIRRRTSTRRRHMLIRRLVGCRARSACRTI